MRRWHKALGVSGLALAVLIPSGVAVAATTDSSSVPAATATCNGDHQMLQARDGTGWRHVTPDGTVVAVEPGPGMGHQHMSGPQDGSGPQADRPLDGTGLQWRTAS